MSQYDDFISQRNITFCYVYEVRLNLIASADHMRSTVITLYAF